MMRRSLVGSSGKGKSTVGAVQVPLTIRPVHERHTTVELEELEMLQLLQPIPAFAEQSSQEPLTSILLEEQLVQVLLPAPVQVTQTMEQERAN